MGTKYSSAYFGRARAITIGRQLLYNKLYLVTALEVTITARSLLTTPRLGQDIGDMMASCQSGPRGMAVSTTYSLTQ